MVNLKQLCIDLEHFETPRWAADAILKEEQFNRDHWIFDPCAGTCVLADALHDAGYTDILSNDIHDWGYHLDMKEKFLEYDFTNVDALSIFMNPPFSLAVDFVKKSFEAGAHKIACFQRFAWYESRKRRSFWDECRPSKVYICGDRADCWRHDIPAEGRGSSSPTAHAWFIFEPGRAGKDTELGRIYKPSVDKKE